MKKNRKKDKGQAIVEYIIIIVIIAVAALTVLGVFSTRIQEIIAGVANTFGAEDAQDSIVETEDVFQNNFKDGEAMDLGGSN